MVVALVSCAGEINAQCMFNPSDCNGKGLCNIATEWRDGVSGAAKANGADMFRKQNLKVYFARLKII